MAQLPSQPWNPVAVVERSSCQHPTPITHPNQSLTTPPSHTPANLHPPRTREDRWQETRPKGRVLFGPHGPLPVPLLTFVSQECPCKATPCPPGASHLLTQCPLKSAQYQGEGRGSYQRVEGVLIVWGGRCLSSRTGPLSCTCGQRQESFLVTCHFPTSWLHYNRWKVIIWHEWAMQNSAFCATCRLCCFYWLHAKTNSVTIGDRFMNK